MCTCGKPTINGQPGYRWQPDDKPSVRPAHPPTLADGDELIYDEPGRCGDRIDSHSHHVRLVKAQYGGRYLLVRHGGGDERWRLSCHFDAWWHMLATLDSHRRYWLLMSLATAFRDGRDHGRDTERSRWSLAAVQKRIKIRRRRGQARVEILPPPPAAPTPIPDREAERTADARA